MNKKTIRLFLVISLIVLLTGCGKRVTQAPSPIVPDTTPTTETTTETPEFTKEPADTEAPELTKEPTDTEAPELTKEPSETETPVTTTSAPTPEPIVTPTPIVTSTPKPEATPVVTPVPTPAPTTAPTPVPTPAPTTAPTPVPTPTPTTAPTPAPAAGYDLAKAQEVFNLVNTLRAENGVPALTWDDQLYASAQIRAQEITVVWSHTRPDGTDCFTVSDALHGENIAYGYADANSVVNGWMGSQGHKENILRAGFTRTAIAYYITADGTPYWCHHFGY